MTVKNVTGANVKKGLPTVTRDGKVIKPNGDTKSPFMVGKDALKGAGKAPAHTNSADASGESADTGEYTFGYSEKEVQVSYRYTYHFLQDLTCTYPEDAYTHVLYTYSSSSENIYLVQDANNELGYGEGRIYICNSHSGRETGTIIITAELLNGEEVVASDSYTVNIIIDFGFSEISATATLGKPFTAPTLTNIYGTSVTYSVGNTQIATVDEKQARLCQLIRAIPLFSQRWMLTTVSPHHIRLRYTIPPRRCHTMRVLQRAGANSTLRIRTSATAWRTCGHTTAAISA